MNRFLVFLVCFVFAYASVFSVPLYASGSGFSNTAIEISDKRPVEGSEVTLSIEFTNIEPEKVSGSIAFYNNSELLGSRPLSVLPGESQIVSMPWVVSLGDHSIVAQAENLRIGNSNVRVLTSSTQPLLVSVGFKKSQVAASLGESGSFGAIVSGMWNQAVETTVPMIESIDLWRFEKISPWENTRERLRSDKENAQENKIQAILTMHIAGISLLLFIFSHPVVFFALAGILVIIVLVTLIKKMRRLFRKKYTGDE